MVGYYEVLFLIGGAMDSLDKAVRLIRDITLANLGIVQKSRFRQRSVIVGSRQKKNTKTILYVKSLKVNVYYLQFNVEIHT